MASASAGCSTTVLVFVTLSERIWSSLIIDIHGCFLKTKGDFRAEVSTHSLGQLDMACPYAQRKVASNLNRPDLLCAKMLGSGVT